MEWKYIDSPVKKKFQAQQSLKKVMLTVFCNITTDFHVKGVTVNKCFLLATLWAKFTSFVDSHHEVYI